MPVTLSLEGKVALITGGSRGIGAAAVRMFVQAGAKVFFNYEKSKDAAEGLVRECGESNSAAIACNLNGSESAQALVAACVKRFGRLDVVLANAGISWRSGASTIASCDEAEFEKIVEVDLLGVWRTIRAALPEIVRNKGQVLVTSSAYAFLNGMANAPYAASKAGVEMFTRCLRAEFAYTGATASVAYPGWTATAIAKVAFGANATVTKMNEVGFPGWLRRASPPEQVARAIAKGVRYRRSRIYAPWRWVPFSLFRGIFGVLTDVVLSRHSEMQALIQQLETESRR